MKIKVRTLRSGSFYVDAAKGAKVAWLRQEVASQLKVNDLAQLKMVWEGRVLTDPEPIPSSPEGSILAMVMPAKPPAAVQKMAVAEAGEEDESEEVVFKLPPGASRNTRRVARYLQKELHFPELLLMLIFMVRPRLWLYFFGWLLCCPVASWAGVGPLFVLATLFALVLFNLGSRKEGEASAYTIFNNFRALPGQLTADQIDRQARTGQM